MNSKILTTFVRCTTNKMLTRSVYTIQNKIGNREVVGMGLNGEPTYIDLTEFPMPAIRYKEVTPDIKVLKDKEKGDWKKLSIQEKKILYRASFRQTFAEIDAPTGEWKSIMGVCLGLVTFALWGYIAIRSYVYPPLPESFSEESRLAQLERMKLLNVRPISGLGVD